MKVVDFKKQEKEEVSLWDKIAMSVSQLITEETKGNFILLLDVGDDEILVSTDTTVADAVFLMEAAKLNLIMNPYTFTEDTVH